MRCLSCTKQIPCSLDCLLSIWQETLRTCSCLCTNQTKCRTSSSWCLDFPKSSVTNELVDFKINKIFFKSMRIRLSKNKMSNRLKGTRNGLGMSCQAKLESSSQCVCDSHVSKVPFAFHFGFRMKIIHVKCHWENRSKNKRALTYHRLVIVSNKLLKTDV